MQKVPVALAREGMTLAKPVTRGSGVVLMGAGTPLTAPLLEKLRDLEIPAVVVKGRPLGGDDTPVEQLLADLEERFSTNVADPLCDQIKALLRDDIMRRAQEAQDEGPDD